MFSFDILLSVATGDLLARLEYYAGNIGSILGPDAEGALRVFQADNALEVTGALDEATAGKLEEMYGV